MAIVNTGDVLRIVAKMTYSVNEIQNVFHYRFSGTSGADGLAVLTDIAAGLDEAYAAIQPACPSPLTFATIAGYNVTRDEPLGEVDWPNLTTGGSSSQGLPPQVSALVLFGTGTARSQGRKYLPPFTEAETDGSGLLNAGVLSSIGEWAIAILANIAVEHGFVVPGNWNEALARFAPWVTSQIVTKFKTQRRRANQT